jgi:hypothetical protein
MTALYRQDPIPSLPAPPNPSVRLYPRAWTVLLNSAIVASIEPDERGYCLYYGPEGINARQFRYLSQARRFAANHAACLTSGQLCEHPS